MRHAAFAAFCILSFTRFCFGQSMMESSTSHRTILAARTNFAGPLQGAEAKTEITSRVAAVRKLLGPAVRGGAAPSTSQSPISDPFPINNVIYVDGCANIVNPIYNCHSGGVQQAIHDANGHAGVAGVVVIPPTVNCELVRCPQLAVQMNTTPITIPSFTYIVGYGKYASEFDYAGTGCAFDFPAGTIFSGLVGIGVEQENQQNTGICMEGTVASQTYDNVVADVYLANNVVQNGFVSGQKGIVLTSTPQGGNGTALLRNNIFRDVLILGLNQPVVANASTQDRWDIKIQGVGPSQAAMNLCGMSDIVDLSVEDYSSPQPNTVAFGSPLSSCTNNQVRVVANLLGSGAKMINDLGNGDELHVSDTNASGIGTPSPTAWTVYCGPLAPYCMEILPQLSFASLPVSAPNGAVFLCSDCLSTSRCSGGGPGTLAKRINGVWVCH